MKILTKFAKRGGKFFGVQLTILSMVLNTAYPALTVYALDTADKPATEQATEQNQQDEKDAPKEEVVEEETVKEEVPKEETENPKPEAKITEEAAKTENSSGDESEEEDLSGKVCLDDNDQVKDSSKDDWNVDEEKGIAITKNPVELGVKYQFPLEEKTSVTFACLPKNPEERSQLKIQQLKVSDLDLPEGIKPATEFAYDITTEMKDGDFEYDLTLPGDENVNDDVQVVYAEEKDDLKDESKIKEVKDEDVKVDEEKDEIIVEKLDHFTVFYVATVADTTSPQITAFGITPSEINTESGDQTLTLNVTLADDSAGVCISTDCGSFYNSSPTQLRLQPVSGGSQVVDFVIFDRTSGDDLNGTYTATAIMPQGSASGIWEATFLVVDKLGNNSSLSKTDLENSFGSGSAIITNSIPPTITVETLAEPSATSVTIAWTTDHPATSRVVYGPDSVPVLGDAPNYGYPNSTTEDSTLVTSHSVTIDSLSPNTTYHFRAVSHGSPETVSEEITASTAQTALVINEIDYDKNGTDDAEFIEIKNTGDESVNIGDYALKLVNGSGGGAVVYNTIDLPDFNLEPQDYYVVCGDNSNVANCDLDVSPNTDLIQNGAPDAVALVREGEIIDTVSYEGSVPGYNEGAGTSEEDPGNNSTTSLSRYPDGQDTENNDVDFILACKTPGTENLDLAENCESVQKVKICHATNSETNPFITNEVSINSISKCEDANGHGDHADDIIPSYTYSTCSYPGKNWDTEGQAIWDNDCEIPAISNCGNGKIDDGEECDYGDTDDGDGCSSECMLEKPYFNLAVCYEGQLGEYAKYARFGYLAKSLLPSAVVQVNKVNNGGAVPTFDGVSVGENSPRVWSENTYELNENNYVWTVKIDEIQKTSTIEKISKKNSVVTENNQCPQPEPICGDGIVNGDEQCDYGKLNGQSTCSDSCEWVRECNKEMTANGGFETPTVGHSAKWNIFDNSQVPGWTAQWYDGSSSYSGHERPEPKIELHRGVNGWTPAEGDQYVELDTDWEGSDSSLNGEPSSISLFQEVPTIVGNEYTLSWSYSPRPNHNNNWLQVEVDGTEEFNSGNISGGANVDWKTESYTFVAGSDLTEVRFTELGNPDSLGMFLDDVSVECLGSPKGTVTVTKYNDVSGDGIWGDDSVEPRLEGWEITLKSSDGSSETMTTGANGEVQFSDVDPGDYFLSETIKGNWKQTNIYCTENDEVASTIDTSNNHAFSVQPGKDVRCDIGNQEETCEEGETWASEVIKNNQGTLENGNKIMDPERTKPEYVLGQPDGKFFSIGYGGSITVKFEYPVLDEDGKDLSFHEVTNGRSSYPIEKAKVEVSPDGVFWKEIGEVTNKDNNNGVGYLDFSSTGWPWIQFVRVTDETDDPNHIGSADGYDLDAIDATKGICEQIELKCGDGIKNGEEECDGNDGVTEGENFCSASCELVPIYDGEHNCPDGTVKSQNSIFSTQISSTDPEGEMVDLNGNGKYLFETSGVFNPSAKGKADAGYTSIDNWSSTREGYGIFGKAPDLGAHALLGDLGKGVGIVKWDNDTNFNYDHIYTKYYETDANEAQFLIGDRYGDWFDTDWQNQGGMGDNSGDLNLDVYECVDTGTVTVTKYNDINGDGGWNQGGELYEPALPDWKINLKHDENVNSQVTDEYGKVKFENVLPGDYSVSEDLLPGWRQTSIICSNDDTKNGADLDDSNNHAFSVGPGEDVSCFIANQQLGSIQGRKYKDVNGNGDFDSSEKINNANRLNGWTIDLFNENMDLIKSMATGNDKTEAGPVQKGQYRFINLVPGKYFVCEELQNGWLQSEPSSGQMHDNGYCHEIDLKAGEEKGEVQFGNYEPGSIKIVKNTGSVNAPWLDFGFTGNLGDFSLNGGDDPTTNSQVFENLKLGDYTISENGSPGNWDLTDLTCDSETVSIDKENKTVTVSLLESGQDVECTFTNERRGQIKITKYNDENKDGARNGEEQTIEGWQMFLYESNEDGGWNQIQPREVRTNPSGVANYTGLLPGEYLVCEENREGWANSQPGDQTIQHDGKTCQTAKVEYGENASVIFGNHLNPVTIHAAKIVCESEDDLPNWGNGGPNITETTADNFVENSERKCWFEEGWEFEYGPKDAGYPGDDHVGYADGYVSTGNTGSDGKVEVEIPDLMSYNGRIEMREVLKEGYLPFTYATEGNKNTNNVSAEFYCGSDVMNYDNWEWINDPQYGQDYYCVAWNVKLGSIHGYKWNDINGNREYDCEGEDDDCECGCDFGCEDRKCEECFKDEEESNCEEKLAGWEIFLDENDNGQLDEGEERTTTNENGDYSFENLLPAKYSVCEVLKSEEGWKQTYPGNFAEPQCHTVTIPNENNEQGYNFGNDRPKCTMHIQKNNNEWSNGPDKVGGRVLYTIFVKALGNFINDATVTDLPPDTFNYMSGSWTAHSNVRGDLKKLGITGEPTYHSPGDWNLGKMEEGEEVTLTYEAEIGEGTGNGIYPDLAWAQGTDPSGANLLALSEGSGFAVNDGVVDDNFVGTQIEVEGQQDPSAAVSVRVHKDEDIEEVEKEVEVLGASTSILPATGSDGSWVLLALAALLLGLLLMAGSYLFNKRNKNAGKISTLIFLLVACGSMLALSADAASLSVRVSQPDSLFNDEFNLDFVALDTENRPVKVECLKKGPSDTDFSVFETKTLADGGDSDFCRVGSGVFGETGIYEFKIKATAGSTVVESDVVSSSYDASGPSKPSYIEKDERSSCTNKITFKTANDGQTSYVEVYRSQHQRTFTVGDGSKIQTITIGPNQKYSFNDDLNSTGCGDNYYYAVRAFDDAGNASAVRAEEIEETVEEEKIVEVEVPGEVSESQSGIGSQTAGETGTEEVETQGEETANESGATVSEEGAQSAGETPEGVDVLGERSENLPGKIKNALGSWKFWVSVLVVLAGGIWYYLRKRTSKTIPEIGKEK